MRLDRSNSGSQLCIATKKNSYLTATKYFTCNLSKFKYAIKISWNIFIQRVVFLYKEVFYIARCKVTFLLAQTDYFLREKSTKYLVILAIKISMRLLILNKSRIPPCLFSVDRSIMIFNLSMSLMRACVYVYNITVIGVVLLNMY